MISLATYRRYVRRVKRTERVMEGWQRKQEACLRLLELGEKMLDEGGDEIEAIEHGHL